MPIAKEELIPFQLSVMLNISLTQVNKTNNPRTFISGKIIRLYFTAEKKAAGSIESIDKYGRILARY